MNCNAFNTTILVLRIVAAVTCLISTVNAIITIADGSYVGRSFMPVIGLILLIFLLIWTFIAVADVFAGLHQRYNWVRIMMCISVPYGLLTAYIVTAAYLYAISRRGLVIGFVWMATCNMITDAYLINCLSEQSRRIHA